MRLLVVLSLFLSCICCNVATLVAQSPAAEASAGVKQEQNWARDYLAEDPLVAQQVITLDDLKKGLESSVRRGTLIKRHFGRVQASPEEKREFLLTALKSEYPEVQRQAARELAALGYLEVVIRDSLVDFLNSDDPQLREVAVIGLEQLDFGTTDWPQTYWSALIEALAVEDPDVVRGIAARLESQGAAAVPALLNGLRSAQPRVQRESARILSRVVGSELAAPAATVQEGGRQSPSPMPNRAAPFPTPQPTSSDEAKPKSPSAADVRHSYREADAAKPKTVQVFFGTNRQVYSPEQPPWSKLLLYPLVAVLLIASIVSNWWYPREPKRRGCMGLLMTAMFVIGIGWCLVVFRSELLDRWRIGIGPRFGPRRDQSAQVHYGSCDVSIPPNHQVGRIEAPLFGPEDEEVHVVLQKTDLLEEAAFFEVVRAQTAALPKDQRSCFVFIHGFNVSFENAAKRTAQIHYDLKFSGIPIFFSWPSRASLRHYFSDRNEIDFSRQVIKQFLLDVSRRVEADRIHVIAHSMGADATCRAIAELGDQGKIFDQVILAAPDIDREVFRLQVAPRMLQAANRTTMYCSKNDWALLASQSFNDSPRAGDSRDSVLVVKDVDTIDASGIDTDLLGHSYYGDCLPILNDVEQLLAFDLPPEERKLLPWPVDNDLTYWTLADAQVTATATAAGNPEQDFQPSPN